MALLETLQNHRNKSKAKRQARKAQKARKRAKKSSGGGELVGDFFELLGEVLSLFR